MAVSLDVYLKMLRDMTPERNPLMREPAAAVLGPAAVDLTHAMADFVDAFRAYSDKGYIGALSFMRAIVMGFPLPPTADAEDIDEFLAMLRASETPEADK